MSDLAMEGGGLPQRIQEKLAELPARPGCYVFRDRRGKSLYVGKAKSLRSRVRSYFQSGSSDLRAFIPLLRASVADLETFVTTSEKEAAILENSLIKERKPRYNVKLRDDKEYLTLRLDGSASWPRLELVRKPVDDGARYFGPFHSATAARRTLHLIEKHFQLRTCSDQELSSRTRPCLQYQIKRCLAPCVYAVDAEQYQHQVKAVGLFLSDRHDELSDELQERMQLASQNLEFEAAARYRDQLQAIRSIRQRQRVLFVTDKNQDVLGLYREGDLVELAVMYVRKGRVVEAATFSYSRIELPSDEVVAAFLRDHYSEEGPSSSWIPDEVIVPVLPDGADGVSEWLSERRRGVLEAAGERAKRCLVMAPARGSRKQLLDLAQDNASHAFKEKKRSADDVDERLLKLQQKLRLPKLPRRIECCDISHLGGKDTVGSIVALFNGKPDKKRYRTYHVKLSGGGDDYSAMYEVLSRRFLRGKKAKSGVEAPPSSSAAEGLESSQPLGEALDVHSELEDVEAPELAEVAWAEGGELMSVDAELAHGVSALEASALEVSPLEAGLQEAPGEGAEDDSTWSLPDLFVVDGGKGQLKVALTAAQDLGLYELAIVGLAKERPTPHGAKAPPRATAKAVLALAEKQAKEQRASEGIEASSERRPEPERLEIAAQNNETKDEPALPVSSASSTRLDSGGEVLDAAAPGGDETSQEPPEEKLVDRVYLPGQKNPVALKPNSPELYLLAHARDEAHRFANRGRKQLGKQRRMHSKLDDVPGVGPVLRKALLTRFGSVAQIRRAEDSELLSVRGVGAKQLKSLREHL